MGSNATIGSVKLELSRAKSVAQTGNRAPYSLCGDTRVGGQRQLDGAAPPAGSYTLRATAYAAGNLGDDQLGTLEESFTVTAQ